MKDCQSSPVNSHSFFIVHSLYRQSQLAEMEFANEGKRSHNIYLSKYFMNIITHLLIFQGDFYSLILVFALFIFTPQLPPHPLNFTVKIPWI